MATPTNNLRGGNGYISDLYQSKRPIDNLGADDLVPKSSQPTGTTNNEGIEQAIKGLDSPTRLVDIHGDYTWTLSPRVARSHIPRIELIEYKQVLSSELMGYAYTLAGEADNFKVAKNVLPVAFRNVGGAIESNVKRALNSSIVDDFTEQLRKGARFAGFNDEDLSEMKEPARQAADQDFVRGDPYNSALRPYTGLYAVEPTGWQYHLPYLESPNVEQSNTWGDPKGHFKEAVGAAMDFLVGSGKSPSTGGSGGSSAGGVDIFKGASALSKGLKALTTSTGAAESKETPQAYQGPSQRDTITVKFYLYNTVKFSDIKRNWEFCYLLTYQNLPNRKGINIMDPPSLYRVLVPGYRQFPMCWVEQLTINNVGAVKMIDITDPDSIIPASSASISPYIKMIPEAYEITIKFKHAFYNSRNLFAYAESPQNSVTVALGDVQPETLT